MTPRAFVKHCLPYAKMVESSTGISAVAILAQAAVESGWGKYAPGNMYFGVKDSDGINGNEQLLITTEYMTRPDAKFPAVLLVVKVGPKLWKYTIKDWFRKYPTPMECFQDHALFLKNNLRYAEALKVAHDPVMFFKEIAKAGYATAPNYAHLLTQVSQSIQHIIRTS